MNGGIVGGSFAFDCFSAVEDFDVDLRAARASAAVPLLLSHTASGWANAGELCMKGFGG